MIQDNEHIYDEQIAPLMTQIIAICNEHKIPMVASFEYAPGELCTTSLPFDGYSDRIKNAIDVIMPRRAPTLMLTERNASGDVKKMTAIVG